MFLRLLLLLTIVPIVELMILLRIAEEIRWGPTILLVLGTGVLGAWLARREGIRVLYRIQSELASGHPPADSMIDGALIVIAGAVLVTPGVLTDLLGFALLIPPARAWIRRRLTDYFKDRIVVIDHGHPEPFVDVEATDADDPKDGAG